MDTKDIEEAILVQLYKDCIDGVDGCDLDGIRAAGGWDRDLFRSAVNRLARRGLIRRRLLEEKYLLSPKGVFYATLVASPEYTYLRVSGRNA